jgi:alpha-mannosidase
MGYAAVDNADGAGGHFDISATADSLENDCVKVRFNRDGSLKSFYDKQAGREILTGRGNRLAAYRDDGDAWDFPANYADRAPRYFALIASRARTEGPRAIVTQRYELGYSKLTQEIVLTAGSKRLEFRTIANWLERQSMLRTSFPVSARSTDATFEIQFGHVKRPTHRNTSWDLAKDEVPAHKWADLSQRDYGVALINDCKYGHKIKDNVVDLCLLRSALYPGARRVQDSEVKPGQPHHAYTDQGEQVFAYAFFPHQGDHVAGKVIQEAYEFNCPVLAFEEKPHAGDLPAENAFLSLDNDAVCIETVKKAEDSGDLIVRLYESTGASVACTLRFGLSIDGVAETDLMEENPRAIPLRNASAPVSFRPFEIKTLRVRTRSTGSER